MKEQRFRPFFFTQFLGAFNDNVFKTALITLVTFHAVSITTMDGSMLATVLPGLFILPFFLFSALAGQLADKFEKSQIIRIIKVFEIGIMLFASAGFYLHHIWLLGVALFMMGMHSTIFGPVKYSYLPQHLKENELIGGNGMLEMGTFVAILLGQVLGAWMAAQSQYETLISMVVLLIALIGYIMSRGVPHSPAAAPHLTIHWNPVSSTYRSIQFVWQHQNIWLAIIAISWFWFFGATLLAQFPNFAKQVLLGDEGVYILLLSVFSIGIGIGSLACEKLSKGKVELGLVLLGAIGLTVATMDLFFANMAVTDALRYAEPKSAVNFQQFLGLQPLKGLKLLEHWHLLADLALIGFSGGLYIVPLYALIQTRAEKSHQSRVIAANNILNAMFMVLSVLFSVWMFKQQFNIPQLFLVTALLNVLVMVYLCWRQPEYPLAFSKWIKSFVK